MLCADPHVGAWLWVPWCCSSNPCTSGALYLDPHLLSPRLLFVPWCCGAFLLCAVVSVNSMGWYHAHNILEGLCPSARLTDVVEPHFMGAVLGTPAAEPFAAFANAHPGVRFHKSVADMPAVDGAKVALLAGRTADNPKLLEAVIAKGCTTVYLEKPGAPSVEELESMQELAVQKGVKVYMGYNKNVTKYVAAALAKEAEAGEGASTAFYHNNTYTPDKLEECFERNAEGMLKNMAVHELALLVTFYGVRSDNIEEAWSCAIAPVCRVTEELQQMPCMRGSGSMRRLSDHVVAIVRAGVCSAPSNIPTDLASPMLPWCRLR